MFKEKIERVNVFKCTGPVFNLCEPSVLSPNSFVKFILLPVPKYFSKSPDTILLLVRRSF